MHERSPSPSSLLSRSARTVAAALAAALAGCGDPAHGPTSGTQAPVIVGQPADAEVFLGQTALFQVWASGSGLTYQWSRDGVPIPGATDSHVTTSPTAAGDDGAVFEVAVSANGSAPAASRAARLTVHPPFDLRFQWVGAPIATHYAPEMNMLWGWWVTVDAVGAPVMVGEGLCAPAPPSGNCSWELSWGSSLRGFQTTYRSGDLVDFGPAWVEAFSPGGLVTSLDLEEGAGAFAASALLTTQTGTFTPQLGAVALDQLAATASAEGALGRVITAVSFQGGLVTYVSYAWSEAPDARFETRIAATTTSGAVSAATDLAAQGYVITAFGAGNGGANGVVMVGTRRQGETAPREAMVQVITGYFSTPPGYAAVGYLFETAPFATTMILER